MMLKRVFSSLFLVLIVFALVQCARKGTPSGGPKDVTPPKLLRADPPNMTLNFKSNTITLYFDEYVKLKDVQNQLIVSPPLKNTPEITPQSAASKVIEVTIKDTLLENTTYTFNFGQSITDNNEGNANSFLTYVFSTGDYLDSLSVSGAVKDAFNKKVDQFISVMLYKIDTAYTDSTIYKRPPDYITNTLDSSVVFRLNHLKEGTYAMMAVKDQGKNNIFDQKVDKIGFLTDTVTLPTDSVYVLTMFREVSDYSIAVPSMAAKNRIMFGYQGTADEIAIQPLTSLPDTVRTTIVKQADKDTLDYWFTPFEMDSIVFLVTNDKWKTRDTFTVKNRKLPLDTLLLTPNLKGSIGFEDPFYISSNTPLTSVDSTKFSLENKDTIPVPFKIRLDSIPNKIHIDFGTEPNQNYNMSIMPGAIGDFFGSVNDTLRYRLSTGSPADYGNLRLTLGGDPTYPLIVQLTDESGKAQREIIAREPQIYDFNNLKPAKYVIRVIHDTNGNGKWDTGSYLQKKQPEKVSYFPDVVEVRANWEMEQTFILGD